MEYFLIFLPLLGAIISGFFGRYIGDRNSEIITSLFVTFSAIISLINFYEVIKINPSYTNSHRTLSRIINYTDDEKHFHEMKKIYKQIDINDTENKTNITFALGKAYEDIRDFDKSFKF